MTQITIDAAVVQQAIEALYAGKKLVAESKWLKDMQASCADALRTAIEQAEGQEPQKVGIEEIRLWAVRHDVNGSDLDLRCAFEAARTHPAPAQPVQEPAVPKNSQDWKGMDGSIAFHLIERHADNWNDISLMMGEWLAANQAQPEGFSPCDMATAAALGFRDGVESVRPAKPLTDEQILDAFCTTPDIHQFVSAFKAGARFAEQAHGIKEQA
jgi:hypothetical protein